MIFLYNKNDIDITNYVRFDIDLLYPVYYNVITDVSIYEIGEYFQVSGEYLYFLLKKGIIPVKVIL